MILKWIKRVVLTLLVIGVAGALGVVGYMLHTRQPRQLSVAAFGHLRYYPAWFKPRGFVYLFSGSQGWSAAEETTARDLARSGHIVMGVDTLEFLATQNPLNGCIFMPGVLEDFSRPWQRDAQLPQYLGPSLLGFDVGATLLYEAQLSAPPTAFSAAVVIDPQTTVAMRRPFCDHPAQSSADGVQTVQPEKPGLNVPLTIVSSGDASKAQQAFAAAIPGQTPTKVGTDVPLRRTYIRTLTAMEEEARRSGVADLPLAVVPAFTGSGTNDASESCAKGFAIFYSGDGGWRDLDRSLAGILASKGMSVAGLDMLRYFWKEKKPDEAAPDLARIIRYYGAHWHCSKVVLIGFSFGADVLPFLVTRLPNELRQKVVLLTLLSPERTTAFEVEVDGWLGGQPKAGVPIGPEVKKLEGLKIQCIYGADE
ncbi:MAG TPA: AcvB/VirJ family lysyl-phosphatidylglycerol hydrolase, partial [Steroidobacteraceae bacterium]|nr:AcvB/VirJ family lysyl-phosphatidylglycerol hydrolase [Steroidobacteraceae bacterium]